MSDMVLLRLLAEQPMHGHQASLELARHRLRTWTGISRPQVYWSLKKLEKMGLICAVETGDVPPPRQRRVFAPTLESRKALEKSLGHKYWTTQLLRPLFLAWMVLAADVSPELLRMQILRRKKFLERELVREKGMLQALRNEDPANGRKILWVIGLNIEQLESELRWLRKLELTVPVAARRGAKIVQRKTA